MFATTMKTVRRASVGLAALSSMVAIPSALANGHHGQTYTAVQGYTLQAVPVATAPMSYQAPAASGQSVGAPQAAAQAPIMQAAPVQMMQAAPVQMMQAAPVQMMQYAPVQMMQAAPVQMMQAAPVQMMQYAPVQMMQAAPVQMMQAAPMVSSTQTAYVATPVQVLIPKAKKFGWIHDHFKNK